MSGRRNRRYRLRKRLRFKRWREEIRLACLMWAGMEFVIEPLEIPLVKSAMVNILVTQYIS